MLKIIFSLLFLALLTSSCFFDNKKIETSETWAIEKNNTWEKVEKSTLSWNILEKEKIPASLMENNSSTWVIKEGKKSETWANIDKKDDTSDKIVDDFTKEIDSVSELLNENGK